MRGITHLVEHLSLPTRWPPEVEFNATVSRLYTHFWFAGPQRTALPMLSTLVRDLVEPPLRRVARERSILRAEDSWRGWPGLSSHALYLRYGPTGVGRTFVPEYGLEWLGRGEIRTWLAQAFCAANARAYMTARPPEDFTVELPRGRRLPPPPSEPVPGVEYPAVFARSTEGGASVSLVVERTFAARMLGRLAERRVRGLLRYRLGITYGGSHYYEPIDSRLAHLFLHADCLPGNVDAVRGGLLVVLDELADRGRTGQELAREVQIAARDARDPRRLAGRLSSNACAELDGRGRVSRDDMLAGLSTATAEDVRACAANALETALLMIPSNATLPGGRFTPYPVSLGRPVRGRRFAAAPGEESGDADDAATLVVGRRGVTLEQSDGAHTTVPFADCAGRIRWGNGIELVSRHGPRLWIDASEWTDGEAAIAKIEQGKVARPSTTSTSAGILPASTSRT
jgi:hypothetical protein